MCHAISKPVHRVALPILSLSTMNPPPVLNRQPMVWISMGRNLQAPSFSNFLILRTKFDLIIKVIALKLFYISCLFTLFDNYNAKTSKKVKFAEGERKSAGQMKGQKESCKMKIELDRLKRIQEEQRGRILYEIEKQKQACRLLSVF